MYPTLQPGDGIELYVYKDTSEMRVGDVIVYPHPNGTVDVVHRIIAIQGEDVTTRGDNNDKIDPYTVPFADIRGKVTAVKRRSRLIAIRGGSAGLCIHKLMLARKYLLPLVLRPLQYVSALIADFGLFTVFHSLLDLKIVQIQKEGERQRILICGKRAIGRQATGSEEWQIRFPYKYFVDKRRFQKDAGNSYEISNS